MGMEIIDFKATKCKHCYKCVRYCDVKAIQVKDERAVIMPDKCILCGHCLKICPQSAKTLKSDLNMVRGFLREGMRVVVELKREANPQVVLNVRCGGLCCAWDSRM